MTKNVKENIVRCCVVLLLVIGVVSFVIHKCELAWYKEVMREIYYMSENQVDLQYKNTTTAFDKSTSNSRLIVFLMAAERNLYIGKISSESECITITVPDKIIMKLYPNDEDSIFITIRKNKGISVKYKLSNTGGFDKYCEELYKITENEVFKN